MVVSSVTCSAPGSTMVMGEHAVLHGYPALAAAIDLRLAVTLCKQDNDEIYIDSAMGQWQASVAQTLAVSVNNQPLRFVLAGLQYFSQSLAGSSGLRITIESAIDPTMGFASSAALTVALVGALRAWLQLDRARYVVLNDAVSIIRQVQGGGSGADAAASCYGGLVYYDASLACARALLPASTASLPALRLIYTGYKTPTPEVIALVRQWAQKDLHRYTQIYARMGELVSHAEAAIEQANWQALAQAMNDYQQQMVALGVCDDGTQAAVDAAWKQVGIMSADSAVAVKISGSGLGDCILGLSVPKIQDWPHAQFTVDISAQGLQWFES